jgi:hypothetical protein
MLKNVLFLSLISLGLTSCSMINSLQRNQQAIDCSTGMILENTQAIEEANSQIKENSHRLGEINKVLEKAGEK